MTIRDALGRWWIAIEALAIAASFFWLMTATLAPLTPAVTIVVMPRGLPGTVEPDEVGVSAER